MDKIKWISTILRYILFVVLVSAFVFEFGGWFFFDGTPESFFVPEFMMYFDPKDLKNITYYQRFCGVLISTPSVLLILFSVWQLVKLFTLYSKGLIFTAANSSCYRLAAWAMLAGDLLQPFVIYGIANVVVENKTMARFDWATIDIGSIVVACAILVISWVMEEGRKLQDDAELTI